MICDSCAPERSECTCKSGSHGRPVLIGPSLSTGHLRPCAHLHTVASVCSASQRRGSGAVVGQCASTPITACIEHPASRYRPPTARRGRPRSAAARRSRRAPGARRPRNSVTQPKLSPPRLLTSTPQLQQQTGDCSRRNWSRRCSQRSNPGRGHQRSELQIPQQSPAWKPPPPQSLTRADGRPLLHPQRRPLLAAMPAADPQTKGGVRLW